LVHIGEAEHKLRTELAREGRLYVVEPNPNDTKFSPWTTRCTGPNNLILGSVSYYGTCEEAEWHAELENRAEVLRYYDKLEFEEVSNRLKQVMPPQPGVVAPTGPYSAVFGSRRKWYVVDGSGQIVSDGMRKINAIHLANTYTRSRHGHKAGPLAQLVGWLVFALAVFLVLAGVSR
jgi:hypothetical protein